MVDDRRDAESPGAIAATNADVAVIGAGFTGLSAALALAKRGAKVVVLESETIGWGASSRNGGMVLPGLKLGVNKLISMYGRELTHRMYAASVETIGTVENIIQEENIACDFARTGHIEVACKQAHFDDYARQVEVIAREFNHELRVVSRNELSSEIGSGIYYGGMVDECSAGLNPARYVAGLAAAAMRNGAQIAERTKLLGIDRAANNGAQNFRLATSRGNLLRSQCPGRDQRLYRTRHACSAKENYPHWLVHYYDRSTARYSCSRIEPA